jgi:hypothetical protein
MPPVSHRLVALIFVVAAVGFVATAPTALADHRGGGYGYRCSPFGGDHSPYFSNIDSSVPCGAIKPVLRAWGHFYYHHGPKRFYFHHWTCYTQVPYHDRPGCVSSVIDGGIVLTWLGLDR